MTVWWTAIRIARREVLRAKGRSTLVVAMIALPVLVLTFSAVSYDMFRLTPAEQVQRDMGAADARVTWPSAGPVFQSDDALSWDGVAEPRGAYTRDDLLGVLPAGSRVLREYRTVVTARTPHGQAGINARELDLADPLVRGYATVRAGRAPVRAGEVAISEQAVDRFGVRLGGAIDIVGAGHYVSAGHYVITGIVEFPQELLAMVVFPDGTFAPGVAAEPDVYSLSWLVDTPGPVRWPDVLRLNAYGIVALSRDVRLHPPPAEERTVYPLTGDGSVPADDLAVGVLVFGLGVLEVVLLAGPAFVVGARRRARQLALVAANGGTPAHVRRIVLADGVVLGGLAAATGVALGIAAGFVLRPILEVYLYQYRAGGYRVFPSMLVAIGALAMVTGVLGALVPAFVAARQDVVATLAGRRGIARSRRRWVVLGVAMCASGAGIAAYAASVVDANLVLTGLVVGELGLALCTPALVGLIARAGRILPLAPRIALRDTARNRAAAAPAISAVMAAVAGAVALAAFLDSTEARDRAAYQPAKPIGTFIVGYRDVERNVGPGAMAPAAAYLNPPVAELRAAVRDAVGGAAVHDLWIGDCGPRTAPECQLAARIPPANLCPFYDRPLPLSRADQQAARRDRRCAMVSGSAYARYGAVVDDGDALAAMTGATGEDLAAATAMLRAGGAVVTNPLLIDGGTVRLTATAYLGPAGLVGPDVVVPAYALRTGLATEAVFVSPAAITAAGYGSRWVGLVGRFDGPVTDAERDRLGGALADLGGYVDVETEPPLATGPTTLLLAIAAGVITLGAAGIATGLAATEGRADLSTLGAVGASPRVRRLLSLSQSGVIAGLGSVLGAAAGLGAASAVLLALNRVYATTWPAPLPYPVTVPWVVLVVVLLVVPAVAMLGAGLLTRSRLPIERQPTW